MSADIVPFMFKDNAVRTVERDGDPWFVGRDVCRVLDIAKVEQALGRLENDERGTYTIGTPGGDQSMIVISEPGVYRLVFSSRKAEAEEFKRWLAHEVLPQIRKTGKFAPVEPASPALWDDQAVALLNIKLDFVREYRRAKGPAAAARMWTYLGLPEPTAQGQAPAEVHSGARCLAHFMAAEAPDGRRWGKIVELALSSEEYRSEVSLAAWGVRVKDDDPGLVFANGHDWLGKVFAGTVWADGRWSVALRRLPGAHPVGAQRFAGLTARGTFVPADVLIDAAIAADPR